MRSVIFTLAALLVSGTACAQPYVGLAAGATKQALSCDGIWSCDNRDTGFKVYGGYKFTPFIAGELTYTDFGKVKVIYVPEFVSRTYKATSVALGATAFIPLAPRMTGLARLGVASNRGERSTSSFGFQFFSSESHTRPYFGLGLAVELMRGLSIDSAYDVTKIEYGSEKANATLLSVGLSYTF